MKYMARKIKSLLVWLFFICRSILFCAVGIFITKKDFTDKQTIYLIGTPEHDNLGDHLIALSELQFIDTYFPDYSVVEVCVEKFDLYRLNLRMYVKQNDLIFLTGGGNIGDTYLLDNKARNYMIKNFKNNMTVIFPQTVYFSDTPSGKEKFGVAMELYRSHPKLIVALREKKSFDIIKENLADKKVIFCPDMAFFRKTDIKSTRHGIGVCLRNDGEALLSDVEREKIISQIKDTDLIFFSTCADGCVKKEQREEKISELLELCSGLQIIITDRLHALIIAVMTKTPCIIIDSASHKIKGTYDLLKDETNVIFENNIENIIDDIAKIYNSDRVINNVDFSQYYDNLYKHIKSVMN